jgi:hypothetical protein
MLKGSNVERLTVTLTENRRMEAGCVTAAAWWGLPRMSADRSYVRLIAKG